MRFRFRCDGWYSVPREAKRTCCTSARVGDVRGDGLRADKVGCAKENGLVRASVNAVLQVASAFDPAADGSFAS